MRTCRECIGCFVALLGMLFSSISVVHALDVTLAWDANTEPELAGYMLYYGTEASGGPYTGSGAAEGDSPIDVGNVTEFTLHDLSDGEVHFFVVTAYSGDGTESDNSNEADVLSMELSQGSNLVSLYRQPVDTSITSVLQSISGKYTSVWAFVDGSWKVYDPENPAFSDLREMEVGRGYWIDMNQTATLPVFGLVPSDQMSLSSGSNLVGYNSATIQEVAQAMGSIEDQCVSVWAFIDGSWRVYDPANPGFSDLVNMEPGYGYWIDAYGPCNWTVP